MGSDDRGRSRRRPAMDGVEARGRAVTLAPAREAATARHAYGEGGKMNSGMVMFNKFCF